jgi:hypothetical protein
MVWIPEKALEKKQESNIRANLSKALEKRSKSEAISSETFEMILEIYQKAYKIYFASNHFAPPTAKNQLAQYEDLNTKLYDALLSLRELNKQNLTLGPYIDEVVIENFGAEDTMMLRGETVTLAEYSQTNYELSNPFETGLHFLLELALKASSLPNKYSTDQTSNNGPGQKTYKYYPCIVYLARQFEVPFPDLERSVSPTSVFVTYCHAFLSNYTDYKADNPSKLIQRALTPSTENQI